MADYRDRMEEWRDAARRKARELDEKYNIKDRVESGARAAQDAARRGAEKVAEGAERARREAERINADQKIKEQVTASARQAADEATRVAREAGDAFGDAFRGASRVAGERAEEVFGEARGAYERASKAAGRATKAASRGVRLTRATAAATSGVLKARRWVRENPRQAAMISFSIVAGIPLGASFPGLDRTLFGAHPHWFTHSALPVYGLRKAGEKFDQYLRRREALINAGALSEAERERVEFERKIVRYVGAPLLGAFSCAAGVGMWVQIFQPGRITGAPISWLLGGNPVLDGVWLFANGVLCFQQGYKFFMIALENKEDVERVVRELKGLLPAAPEPSAA